NVMANLVNILNSWDPNVKSFNLRIINVFGAKPDQPAPAPTAQTVVTNDTQPGPVTVDASNPAAGVTYDVADARGASLARGRLAAASPVSVGPAGSPSVTTTSAPIVNLDTAAPASVRVLANEPSVDKASSGTQPQTA